MLIHFSKQLEKGQKLWTESINASAIFENKLFAGGQTGTLGIIDLATGKLLNAVKNAHTDAIQGNAL